MKPKRTPAVKTLAQARKFVLDVKTCLIFGSKKSKLPSLWDVTDLPERQPGEGGWGQRITAVWRWKNELPATFPEEIYYGKLPGGMAALMDMQHLREVHYPQHHKPLSECSALAQKVFSLIRREPQTTKELRQAIPTSATIKKSSIDRALVELQVTLNIVRSNAPEIETDTWLRFTDQYPEFLD